MVDQDSVRISSSGAVMLRLVHGAHSFDGGFLLYISCYYFISLGAKVD